MSNTFLAETPQFEDPCNPSPCGPNANCNNGQCSCAPEYPKGDGYQGCRPECVSNNDCPRDKACVRAKCVNPCERDLCGRNAICEVYNNFASCTCPNSMQGNAFIECRPYEDSTYCKNLFLLSNSIFVFFFISSCCHKPLSTLPMRTLFSMSSNKRPKCMQLLTKHDLKSTFM